MGRDLTSGRLPVSAVPMGPVTGAVSRGTGGTPGA